MAGSRYTGNMQESQAAPDFQILDDTGKLVSLQQFRGRPVVLYFYPRASTPGCTVEAQEFRDHFAEFERRGVTILGVSPDTVKAQKKFKDAQQIPYLLLADEQRELAQLYEVLKEKNMYDKKVIGVERTTFLLDPQGHIAHIFCRVKPAGHAQEVLDELERMKLA